MGKVIFSLNEARIPREIVRLEESLRLMVLLAKNLSEHGYESLAEDISLQADTLASTIQQLKEYKTQLDLLAGLLER